MNLHPISVSGPTNLETSIPSVSSAEAFLAFRVPLTHYVGAELTQVFSDVRAYDGKLYTNDPHFQDTVNGHPADQVRAEVKAGAIPANRYGLYDAPTTRDRFEYDMQQFILVDGEVWTQCDEPGYQVLASRQGVMIEATMSRSASGRPGILFAANDWYSALRQGFAIAADRGLGNFNESLEAARRIHVLNERAVTREPYEDVLERRTREVQAIAGRIANLGAAAERRGIHDATKTLQEIEAAVAEAREALKGIYVVEGF